MSNIFRNFPDKGVLEEWYLTNGSGRIHDVNGHIHSPYSFSAFVDMDQAFGMASEEKVSILGINDFNTTLGYEEFFKLGMKYRIFPLFNIEFMGLLRDEQKEGVRINDPNNPGRIYFSGKGLDFPVSWGDDTVRKVDSLILESHSQVREMINKINRYLTSFDSSLQLDFDEIRRDLTKGMVRERHIARALRIMAEKFHAPARERKLFYSKLFGGKDPVADVDDHAEIENEIRGKLLKAGGAAFVEEDPSAFLDLSDIISIISDAGGIPCYPVLLDDNRGNITEFESDKEKLYKNLTESGVYCIELIPGRNDHGVLRDFVSWFRKKGFIVILGTEHNTPSIEPVSVSSRGGVRLGDDLRLAAWEGACIVAAHQYLRGKGEQGYVNLPGLAGESNRDEYIQLGKAVIEKFISG